MSVTLVQFQTADLLITISSAMEESDMVYIYLVIGIYRAIQVNTVTTQIDVVTCHPTLQSTVFNFKSNT